MSATQGTVAEAASASTEIRFTFIQCGFDEADLDAYGMRRFAYRCKGYIGLTFGDQDDEFLDKEFICWLRTTASLAGIRYVI